MTTKIEWADDVWTPVVGCDAVSPACAFCYAATMAARLESMGMEKYSGLATRHGSIGKWTGKVTVWEPEILRPLSVKKPRSWFLTSMGDVGHEKVSDETLDRLFAVMALTPHHTYYVLTKRTNRMRAYLSDLSMPARVVSQMQTMFGPGYPRGFYEEIRDFAENGGFPRPNIIIGCTAEDQDRADERRPHMKAIADLGWRTMVSYEPALGLVNWRGWEFLKWLIGGGESGPKARPCHPHWQRVARDWCAAHDIPYLLKQWGTWHSDALLYTDAITGENPPKSFRIGKKAAGRLLDGIEHNGFPRRAGVVDTP